MTNLDGMPSYFWLTSSRLKEPIQDDVPYTTQALREDLRRVRNAWDECQAQRDRDAIYGYLTAVFNLVAWWKAEGRAISRARWALRLQKLCSLLLTRLASRRSSGRPRHCRPADERDELASFQLIELHSIPPRRAELQDIELARISQRVSRAFCKV
jgi:hypothetical protein